MTKIENKPAMIKTDNKVTVGKENKPVTSTVKQPSKSNLCKPTAPTEKNPSNDNVKNNVFKVPQPVPPKPQSSKDDVRLLLVNISQTKNLRLIIFFLNIS